jgi:hypothetical protein
MNRKLGIVGIVIAALLVSGVSAWVILAPTKVVVTNYSVKKTEAVWQAYGGSWTSPPLTLTLGALYGAQESKTSGTIRLNVTTFAPINVTFYVGDDSALSGLQSWNVTIARVDYGKVGELTALGQTVTDTPSGDTTYVYNIYVSGKAVNYTQSDISGYINLYAEVKTPS